MSLALAPIKTGPSLAAQAPALAVLLSEEFGTPFTLFDAVTGGTLVSQESGKIDLNAIDLVANLSSRDTAQAAAMGEGRYRLALLLRDEGRPAVAAVGFLSGFARQRHDSVQEQERLVKWARAVGQRLETMHRSAAGSSTSDHRLPQAWEALFALNSLLRRSRIHQDPGRGQRRILQSAATLLDVQSLAWVPHNPAQPIHVLGQSVITPRECRQLAMQLERSSDWDSSGVLVANQCRAKGWAAYQGPLESLLAIRVAEEDMSGYLIAFNKQARASASPGGHEVIPGRARGASTSTSAVPARPGVFRRSDAALVTPLLALMGMQLRAGCRFRELKDFVVGLARSLTSAIDAKDKYTYGHSERVARIAVELGREQELQEDELSNVYLAGLLHDIGKIGIRDSVLGKQGPLSPEETQHIQEHVMTGYHILAGLSQLRDVLPGVLHHHERYDGKGYPDGLAGEKIPLLARILAVADSFDAMSTQRPYRAALAEARVEQILRDGAGSQWSPRVIQAYLRCKDRLRAIHQRGVGESLRCALDGALGDAAKNLDGSSTSLPAMAAVR
jgi:HD-GYP domain-containing protein (c-di-GMP phosphodiesterase class II)